MKLKARAIIFSHLSDAQEESSMGLVQSVQSHLNFVKFIITECDGELNQKIDADELWARFIQTPYYRG
jgi:hypothetical protein